MAVSEWNWKLLGFIFFFIGFVINLGFSWFWCLAWDMPVLWQSVSFSSVNNWFWSCCFKGSFFLIWFILIMQHGKVSYPRLCFKCCYLWSSKETPICYLPDTFRLSFWIRTFCSVCSLSLSHFFSRDEDKQLN